jgi:hypothetical protein
MFENERKPALTKDELAERVKLFVPGRYIMVRQKKFGGKQPTVWTFYEIGERVEHDANLTVIFDANRVRGMVDQSWTKTVERTSIRVHAEYHVEIYSTFAEADHAANYYNLMYRTEMMHRAVMTNMTAAKPVELAPTIVGTDSAGDYMEFFTVLSVFASLAIEDEEEKNLLGSFYAEIEPVIEKYIAKRMLLGKAFA